MSGTFWAALLLTNVGAAESAACDASELSCRNYSPWLKAVVGAAVKRGQTSVTVVDVTDDRRRGAVGGEELLYPASVVKLAYLLLYFRRVDSRLLIPNVAQQWNVEEMIRHSHNPAAGRVMDRLTRTTPGPAQSGDAWEEFRRRRLAINRELAALGMRSVFAHQRVWSAMSARDRKLLRHERSNIMSTNDTARLLLGVDRCEWLSRARCQELRFLLQRHVTDETDARFLPIANGLPVGARFWSKPGLTTGTHQDAAIVELPNGARYVLVVFLRARDSDGSAITEISRAIAAAFGQRL